MSMSGPGPEVELIEHAAKVIVEARKEPHTAPYHWAAALHRAGMLVAPGSATSWDFESRVREFEKQSPATPITLALLQIDRSAALAGLAVKDSALAEREALTPWQRLPDLPESAYPPDAVPLDPPVAGTGGPW